MAEGPIGLQEIANREYLGPNKTGDNIDAQRVAPYGWDATAQTWARQPVGAAALINSAWDAMAVNTVSSTSTYQFYHGGLGGTLVATLTLNFTDSTLTTLVSIVKT